MKGINLMLAICLLIEIASAQEIVSKNQFLLHENKGEAYRFVDDKYEPDLSLYKFYTVTNYQKENDTKHYYQLNQFKIHSETLELIEVLEDKKAVNSKIMGMHNVDPNFLQETEPENKIFEAQITFQTFNIKYLSEDKTKVISNKSKVPIMDGKALLKGQYHVNYAEQTTLAFYGEKKKGKEFKNNEHKNLTLIKLDRDANTVVTKDLTLDHPRNLINITGVSSADIAREDQLGEQGAMLLFDKPRGMKSKDNHPDMNSYLVVYIDVTGNIKYQYKIDIEGVKNIFPSYVYKVGEDLVMLAKTYGNGAAYVNMIFDESGMKNMKKYSYKALNEETDSKFLLTAQYFYEVDYHTILDDGTWG